MYTFGTPDPSLFPIPDIRVYRLCIVFAVVAGRSSEAELAGYTLQSARLHAMALKHIGAAFEADEIVRSSPAPGMKLMRDMLHLYLLARSHGGAGVCDDEPLRGVADSVHDEHRNASARRTSGLASRGTG